MRAVAQRVINASVQVGDTTVAEIGKGILVLFGVHKGDGEDKARFLASKIANMRIFEDDQGKMNLALADMAGAMLVVSQFTLLGDCRRGRRPGFTAAAPPEVAERLYTVFVQTVAAVGIEVATGRFRQHMEVELVNDGPVTLLLDTKEK